MLDAFYFLVYFQLHFTFWKWRQGRALPPSVLNAVAKYIFSFEVAFLKLQSWAPKKLSVFEQFLIICKYCKISWLPKVSEMILFIYLSKVNKSSLTVIVHHLPILSEKKQLFIFNVFYHFSILLTLARPK